MPTPRARSRRITSNRRSTSSAGRLAVGSSSTRNAQSEAMARAMATSDFSVRPSEATRASGSASQPTSASASPARRAVARQSIARNAPPRA